MIYIQKAEKEADLYYRLEQIENDFKRALEETRKEPGFSILDISKVIKKVLKPEEVRALIRHLNNEKTKP